MCAAQRMCTLHTSQQTLCSLPVVPCWTVRNCPHLLPPASVPAWPLPLPLQEKGWDVGRTIEKLLHNGARISAEAHEIVRVPGLLTDADMIGGWAAGWREASLCRIGFCWIPVPC